MLVSSAAISLSFSPATTIYCFFAMRVKQKRCKERSVSHNETLSLFSFLLILLSLTIAAFSCYFFFFPPFFLAAIPEYVYYYYY
jgi:hypothetical protein